MHKHSFDSLTLSSNSQYLITSGDNILKFWDAEMELDVNYQVNLSQFEEDFVGILLQNFIGHSEQVRKVFFTDDDRHVISIGDSILIWDVLAWNTSQPIMPK